MYTKVPKTICSIMNRTSIVTSDMLINQVVTSDEYTFLDNSRYVVKVKEEIENEIVVTVKNIFNRFNRLVKVEFL